jgi:DNA-binding SARP family transcriptional activator
MLGHAAAHVHLFGGLRLVFPTFTVAEGSIATKAAAVIKLLAIRPGHTAHRDEIAGTLWADSDDRRGANNLYKALHQLREQLPDAQTKELVQIRRKVVSFAPWVEVDLDQYLAASRIARDTKSRESYDRALAHGAAQILPCDIYEDWTRDVRESVLRLDQQLRFEAAELCLLSDDVPRAAEHLRAVLAVDVANERAHRLLIESYLAHGELANAVRQYEACVKALDAELGLLPSEETTALYSRIKRASASASIGRAK